MNSSYRLKKWGFLFLVPFIFLNCGGGGDSSSQKTSSNAPTDRVDNNDEFEQEEYRGLVFYKQNIPSSNYTLKQLSNTSFNALSDAKKLQVADKILSTFFFSYPLETLQSKIKSGDFIDMIRASLKEDKTDKGELENHIVDKDIFQQTDYNEQVAVDILTRFYAMKELDSYFLKNWVSYILTQTIMFSPAYELDSTHTPNIARVYNRIVRMLEVDSGMRYIAYVHMSSEDNWRRFRSPEDNGREMLEIFTLDMDDSHVPLAGKALQNWKLDRDHDTLVVSLNENRTPIKLFNTTIYNGDDFYREMAKSDAFTKGVTTRLVHFFFPNSTSIKQNSIVNSIVKSNPETWEDILLQIVFSEEYLLKSSRGKSAEELFFPLSKKFNFKHRMSTFHDFKRSLEKMHQASMKYKLGKLQRVPLDTLSFAYYHKYIREEMLLRISNSSKIDDYNAWDRQGWSQDFISNGKFNFDEYDGVKSLESLINYLFQSMISRNAKSSEMALFKNHMLRNKSETNTTKILDDRFNLTTRRDDLEDEKKRRESRKVNIAVIVLDYISRLSETYTLKEVK